MLEIPTFQTGVQEAEIQEAEIQEAEAQEAEAQEAEVQEAKAQEAEIQEAEALPARLWSLALVAAIKNLTTIRSQPEKTGAKAKWNSFVTFSPAVRHSTSRS